MSPRRVRLRATARHLSMATFLALGEILGLLRCHRAAAGILGRGANTYPELRDVFLVARGKRYARLGRREEAIRDVEEAMRLAPENPFHVLYMAQVYEELSSPFEAIRYYERAATSPSREFSDSRRQHIRSRIDALRGAVKH